MSETEPKQGRRVLLLPAAIVAILVALAFWLSRDLGRVPEPVVERPAPVEFAERLERVEGVERAPVAAAPKPSADYHYELPIHPAGSASAEQPTHPHPFTPQHERIFRENNLIGQLNGAMDVKDAQGMRRLLADYRDEFPEDEHVMQDGYQLILDCLESPGDATRAPAQQYYDTQIASGLRRYIRRHCLEN